MRVHVFKSWPPEFEAVVEGLKPFEIRRDDRDPKVMPGDLVVLREFKPYKNPEETTTRSAGEFTGRVMVREVGYVERSTCLPSGWFGFSLIVAPALVAWELRARYEGVVTE